MWSTEMRLASSIGNNLVPEHVGTLGLAIGLGMGPLVVSYLVCLKANDQSVGENDCTSPGTCWADMFRVDGTAEDVANK